MKDRIRIFSNGSQDADWLGRNCLQCKKWGEKVSASCEIADAMQLAYFDDGTLSAEMAKRMGYPGPAVAYTWDCPEREEKP